MSYVLGALGILGLYLAGEDNKWGWFLGMCLQILWAWYGIVTHQYGFLITCVGFGFVHTKNFIRCVKKERDVTSNLNRGTSGKW